MVRYEDDEIIMKQQKKSGLSRGKAFRRTTALILYNMIQIPCADTGAAGRTCFFKGIFIWAGSQPGRFLGNAL